MLHDVPSFTRQLFRHAVATGNTTKTIYVGLLTVYSVVGTSYLHGWANITAVVGILLLVPMGVVIYHASTEPKDPIGDLLRAPIQNQKALRSELHRARDQGLGTWWEGSESESRWFDDLFVFWWKARGVLAEDVSLIVSEPRITSDDFVGVPAEVVRPARSERSKAALVRASAFRSDVPAQISCAPIDYELCMWVGQNGQVFRDQNPDVTTFGVNGWLAYPAMLCTHNVVMTCDGWLLLCLRSPRTDFFPNLWSASFEEQVELGSTGQQAQGDENIAQTVRRGVREELGEKLKANIRRITLLALAREHTETETRSIRSAAAITVAELDVPLSALWDSLSQPGHVQDLSESSAWMACRFPTHASVVGLLKRFPPGNSTSISPDAIRGDHMLAVEVSLHPASSSRVARGTGFGWHPTARTRLLLWAEWAVASGHFQRRTVDDEVLTDGSRPENLGSSQ